MDDGQKHNDQIFAHNLCETCFATHGLIPAFTRVLADPFCRRNKYVMFFLLFVCFFFFCNFFYFSDDESNPFERPIEKNNNQKCEKALRLRSLAFTNFLVFRKPDKTLPCL